METSSYNKKNSLSVVGDEAQDSTAVGTPRGLAGGCEELAKEMSPTFLQKNGMQGNTALLAALAPTSF